MLATFAQFETDVRSERQREGIMRVKADPKLRSEKYAERKPVIDRKQVLAMAADKRGPSYIAEQLGISRMSVHRILKGKETAQ